MRTTRYRYWTTGLALATLLVACGDEAPSSEGSGGASGAGGAAGSSPAGSGPGASGGGSSGGSANFAGASGSGASGGTGGGSVAGSENGGSAGASGGGEAGTAGASSSGGSAGSGSCEGKTLTSGESTRTIQIDGASRSYILHVPSSYSGATAVPLVLDFHPLGGTGAGEKGVLGMGAIADREGFIVAWPNGIDNAWNIGPCCTVSRSVNDLGFARGMVDAISSEGCVDAKRVYATGFSMGGGMSHFLGCNAADVFAAVAPHAFDLLQENEEPCAPSRPMSVLAFRGTNDFLIPWNGGASSPPNGCCPDIHFLGAIGTFTKWATLSQCTGNPTTTGNTQLHTQCAGGAQVGLVTIQGGGHAAGSGETTWEFLKAHSLP
jgi:polyhydroxybutyrate depolymerase